MNEKASMTLPSEPEKTGVRAEQERATESRTPEVVLPETEGIEEYGLSTTIKDYLEKGVRSGPGMAFLYTFVGKLEKDANLLRAEKSLIQRELDKWKEQYYKCNERCSVLIERARGVKKFRILQNVFVTIGGLIAGGSIKFIDTQHASLTPIGIIVGIMLMLVGWFYPYSNGEEK